MPEPALHTQARPVADRFHLLQNLLERIEQKFSRSRVAAPSALIEAGVQAASAQFEDDSIPGRPEYETLDKLPFLQMRKSQRSGGMTTRS